METPVVDPEFQKQDCRNRRVRPRAWLKVGIGAAGFGVMLGLFFLIGKVFGYQYVISPFRMIPFCIPFVYFASG